MSSEDVDKMEKKAQEAKQTFLQKLQNDGV